MTYTTLSDLDKKWLGNVIAEREANLKDVSGALASEVISDFFVLLNGTMIAGSAVTTLSLVPLALTPLPMVQLSLAYVAIKSLMDQRQKLQDDVQVLNAILQVDEETPENITAMVSQYIEIHANPDNESRPSRIEIKRLSRDALMKIQKNFRTKKQKLTFTEKVLTSANFLKEEFANAATMVGKTVINPLDLGRSVITSTRNIRAIYNKWDINKETRNSKTLRETYNYMIRRALREDENNKMPRKVEDYFTERRRDQLFYLHQQQASLRTASRLRLETAAGVIACSGIILIALYETAMSTTTFAMIGGIYTIIASLPSLKVLGRELDSLTKTVDKYSPNVNRAAAEFMMDMPGMRR